MATSPRYAHPNHTLSRKVFAISRKSERGCVGVPRSRMCVANTSKNASTWSLPNRYVTPSFAGRRTWLLSGRVNVAGRTLEFGPLLEVVALASSPTFASWAGGFETSAGLPAGTLANSPAADYNKDGVANLMAYALNLSPVSNAARSLPLPAVASGALRLDYPRITDRADVSVVPQISANLVNWFTPGQAGAPAGFTDTALSSTGNVQTRRASIAAGSQRYYLRLKAAKL